PSLKRLVIHTLDTAAARRTPSLVKEGSSRPRHQKDLAKPPLKGASVLRDFLLLARPPSFSRRGKRPPSGNLHQTILLGETMSFRGRLSYFLILAAAFLPTLASSQARRSASWFEGARLITGDKSPVIENSAFLVEGDSFTWVGKKGERQPPANALRVDLTGKTVMPTLIDGHNHIGLVNEKDGSNKKANYTRENLVDQLQRYAYYGTGA